PGRTGGNPHVIATVAIRAEVQRIERLMSSTELCQEPVHGERIDASRRGRRYVAGGNGQRAESVTKRVHEIHLQPHPEIEVASGIGGETVRTPVSITT